MSKELKLCPFCGREAELIKSKRKEGYHLVQCSKCWASTSLNTSAHVAVELWNNRSGEGLNNYALIDREKADKLHYMVGSVWAIANYPANEASRKELEEIKTEVIDILCTVNFKLDQPLGLGIINK